jgi:hypothetical protein
LGIRPKLCASQIPISRGCWPRAIPSFGRTGLILSIGRIHRRLWNFGEWLLPLDDSVCRAQSPAGKPWKVEKQPWILSKKLWSHYQTKGNRLWVGDDKGPDRVKLNPVIALSNVWVFQTPLNRITNIGRQWAKGTTHVFDWWQPASCLSGATRFEKVNGKALTYPEVLPYISNTTPPSWLVVPLVVHANWKLHQVATGCIIQ